MLIFGFALSFLSQVDYLVSNPFAYYSTVTIVILELAPLYLLQPLPPKNYSSEMLSKSSPP
jgi:hypothetical protein